MNEELLRGSVPATDSNLFSLDLVAKQAKKFNNPISEQHQRESEDANSIPEEVKDEDDEYDFDEFERVS